jgi:hypothetical protein
MDQYEPLHLKSQWLLSKPLDHDGTILVVQNILDRVSVFKRSEVFFNRQEMQVMVAQNAFGASLKRHHALDHANIIGSSVDQVA